MTALAVEPELGEDDLVDAGPTRDIVHGMCAVGYPQVWVERKVGRIGRRTVARAVAAAVEELAEWCAGNPGPSDLARQLAAERGWSVDLLWRGAEDEELGPDVDDEVVERTVARALLARTVRATVAKPDLNHDEELEVVSRLLARGLDVGAVVECTGMPRARARKHARRLGWAS